MSNSGEALFLITVAMQNILLPTLSQMGAHSRAGADNQWLGAQSFSEMLLGRGFALSALRQPGT